MPRLWGIALIILLLGPALGRGYVLTYDMVFVPHLAMRSDFLGFGTALPRAVPSDAVVAVLDNLIPGMVLQKLILTGSLFAAAEGMLRLVPASRAARLTAVTVTIWNPYTVERLGIGHWTMLVGYAAVPWLVLVATRARREGTLPMTGWLIAPLGALSASAGVVVAATLLVVGVRSARGAWRSNLQLVCLAVAANAPWLVAGMLHASAALHDEGTSWFGLHAEGGLPAPLAALSMGGIWNREVVPASRTGALAWVALATLGALAVCGARRWWRWGGGVAHRLVALWAVGLGLTLLTWASPEAVAWLAGHLPGGGLLRDAPRLLALCLPVYAGTIAAGVEVLVDGLRHPDLAVPRSVLAVVCVVLPLALMPDVRWGLGGALTPSTFPASWDRAREVAAPGHGDVLLLPLSAYRAPPWTQGRTIIDPLGRFLRPNFLASDDLVVSGTVVSGEDPRLHAARAALARGDAVGRAAALGSLGVGYVAEELDSGLPPSPPIAGTAVLTTTELRLVRLDAVAPRRATTTDRLLLAGAWLAYLACYVTGLAVGIRRVGIRRIRHRSG